MSKLRVGTARVVALTTARRPQVWVRVAIALALAAALVALALSALSPLHAQGTTSARRFAQQPCTPVYASANTSSTLLAQLLGGEDITSLERVAGAGGVQWEHVRFWSGVEGYIPADHLGTTFPADASEGSCPFPGVPEPESDILPESRGPWPLSASGTLAGAATLYTRPDARALPLFGLAAGETVSAQEWASDREGSPWYHVTTQGISGWVWSGQVRLNEPSPVTHQVNGQAVWAKVAGKGMWFTNYQAHHSDMGALMRAAKLAGITHLYAEVAITQYGFYGRNSLDRLLPAAHAAGISVIAWVYPTLSDVAADVRMTLAVANYTTRTGERADGIATDVEEVDDSASVYTYGQLIRGLLGPDTPLVAAVFHPYAQAYYPYAAIAASWNVIAPMDYWHSRAHHTYTPADVRTFVDRSLMTIRASMSALGTDAMLPIEELGQTYDMYSADSAGSADAPTGVEIEADMRAAREAGCIGVSFFEWQTTTQEEWTAISQFAW